MGAVGTVTYVDGQTVYAFGHELDGAGRRSLLLQDAYVYYVVNNPDPTETPSYKLALPGHTLGTLSRATPRTRSSVRLGPPPPAVPGRRDRPRPRHRPSLSLDTQVADETGVGLPLGASLVDAIAPIEVAQAATEIYDGPPANESGSMCLRIYLRESRTPLGFCNRYVGTGVPGDAGWCHRSSRAPPRPTWRTRSRARACRLRGAARQPGGAHMEPGAAWPWPVILSRGRPGGYGRVSRSGYGYACGSTAARCGRVSFRCASRGRPEARHGHAQGPAPPAGPACLDAGLAGA